MLGKNKNVLQRPLDDAFNSQSFRFILKILIRPLILIAKIILEFILRHYPLARPLYMFLSKLQLSENFELNKDDYLKGTIIARKLEYWGCYSILFCYLQIRITGFCVIESLSMRLTGVVTLTSL